MQVMGDMLERIIQTSAQQSTASVPQQTATSDHKPTDELAPSAANGGANSNPLTPILPGTNTFPAKTVWPKLSDTTLHLNSTEQRIFYQQKTGKTGSPFQKVLINTIKQQNQTNFLFTVNF